MHPAPRSSPTRPILTSQFSSALLEKKSSKGRPMIHHLPPLNALKAFEAAARHLSFVRAAGELCVTQGAVSRHILKLEEFLGVKLFIRRHRQVELTREGATYLWEIRSAFTRISQATQSL